MHQMFQLATGEDTFAFSHDCLFFRKPHFVGQKQNNRICGRCIVDAQNLRRKSCEIIK